MENADRGGGRPLTQAVLTEGPPANAGGSDRSSAIQKLLSDWWISCGGGLRRVHMNCAV